MSNILSPLFFVLSAICYNIYILNKILVDKQPSDIFDFTIAFFMLAFLCHARNGHSESK